MAIVFTKNGTTYTLKTYAVPISNGVPATYSYTKGGTEYYCPAVLETETRDCIVKYDSSEKRYWVGRYVSSKPTRKFTKNGSVYACCNSQQLVEIPTNSPKIKSVTLGSVSYGSWSGWTSVTGGQKRTRTFSVKATIVLESADDEYVNSNQIYVKEIKCTTTGTVHTPSTKSLQSGDSITMTVSGSGNDYSTLTFGAYNSSGVAKNSKSVSCTIDAYEFQSE